ncbi:phospho-N-acetylmuramoyl-pentapeptide-transferase [Clostridium swellfunianum]|uniref:phospho-N-acetylmuramoyl-pentapeptide- transferase n=1 Tax=Clostridium swellfunianum TaxID=1367462 RepID=UPI0020307CA3|nr:phospho-N-acetylmuramoyl-pentapeptide-transferase [Clostridium swellfunianum]MCM0650164.1 phospho-N-acetylmuramoyl-pentapeptide-transferase [Clostridium swellfunianum]
MRKIVYAILLGFLLSSIIGTILIPLFKRLKLGQNIREEGPKSHYKKASTPTFGGIVFILSSIIAMLFFIKQYNKEIQFVFYSLIVFGFIGFLDDFLKKVHKKNEGLTSKQKMLLLLFASTTFAIYAYYNPRIGSTIILPFGGRMIDLGLLYIPFIIFIYAATTNSVNLTDGLDGLAASVTLLVMVFFALVAFNLGYYTLSIFCGCMSGALLGFLRFNSFPAKIIMGDTGALALGGMVATIAIILKTPFIIAIVGGIYVLEALSDLIQVISYKTTGKRVFKMAPIHHSFELSGWHEAKIVSLFSIITTILCLIGFLSF